MLVFTSSHVKQAHRWPHSDMYRLTHCGHTLGDTTKPVLICLAPKHLSLRSCGPQAPVEDSAPGILMGGLGSQALVAKKSGIQLWTLPFPVGKESSSSPRDYSVPRFLSYKRNVTKATRITPGRAQRSFRPCLIINPILEICKPRKRLAKRVESFSLGPSGG